MKTPCLLITILLVHLQTLGQTGYQYTQPKSLDDGWKTNTLVAHNIDSTGLYALFSQLCSTPHKIHSVLVVSKDEIILEEYFDQYSSEKRHDLRSVTKSMISLLLGIAIDKGLVDSVEDPVLKYMTSYAPDSQLEKITIKHLLTMSSGLDCNDWDKKSKGQEDRVFKKKDWLRYFLELPIIHEPGTVSNYCSMGTILTAEIINKVSGMTIDEFAGQHLFGPLAITNMHWGHTSEKKEVIPSGKRVYMTPRDMAKVGLMVLNKGKWGDRQIVPEKWIATSTSAKTKITGIGYGFLWWNIPFKVDEGYIHSVVSTGNGGQYIMVFPTLDMIAVFTGGAYNSQEDKVPFAIVNNILLPAFGEKR